MIHCKRYIIVACFTFMLPLTGWSEAPVVDDSDNFAMIEEQQAEKSSVAHPKYDEPQIENAQLDRAHNNNNYPMDTNQDDGPALAKEETHSHLKNEFNDNAKLIDKVQSLQKDIQELRGQLEVQSHDLKLLQQQQVSFYKDLDARLGSTPVKSAQGKPLTLSPTTKTTVPKAITLPVTQPKVASSTKSLPVIAVSRINPADEQISYLAAYESGVFKSITTITRESIAEISRAPLVSIETK